MGNGEFSAGGNPSISSRGEKKYSYSLHATETGIGSGLKNHLACMQTLLLGVFRDHSYLSCQLEIVIEITDRRSVTVGFLAFTSQQGDGGFTQTQPTLRLRGSQR